MKEHQTIKTLKLANFALCYNLDLSQGILTLCPSTTLFSLALGPTNPGLIIIAQETSGFRWKGI